MARDSLRWTVGDALERLSERIKVPAPAGVCLAPGCGYYERDGVHEPVEDCLNLECSAVPEGRSEHHAFVARPGKLRALLTRVARR